MMRRKPCIQIFSGAQTHYRVEYQGYLNYHEYIFKNHDCEIISRPISTKNLLKTFKKYIHQHLYHFCMPGKHFSYSDHQAVLAQV